MNVSSSLCLEQITISGPISCDDEMDGAFNVYIGHVFGHLFDNDNDSEYLTLILQA